MNIFINIFKIIIDCTLVNIWVEIDVVELVGIKLNLGIFNNLIVYFYY